MRSYTVTRSAARAKHLHLCDNSARFWWRWVKTRAHRLDRREWRQYLQQWGPTGGDEQAEARLGIPKATGSDVI